MFSKKPNKNSNKYNRGAVGIITGSKKYIGAGILASETVLKTGVGIVFYYGEAFKEILQKFPEIIVSKKAKNFNDKINCFLVGSGNPPKKDIQKALFFASKNNIPTIVDASAMNTLLKLQLSGNFILTPHKGEYEKLLNTYSKELINNYPIILKGYKTKIKFPEKKIVTVKTYGSEYLSTAGTGDILAGLLASKISQFGYSEKIIKLTVKEHQIAGVKAMKEKKPIIATDIIKYL